MTDAVLIEGYASRFGMEDRVGDVVRAGAFAASLSTKRRIPMLLQHKSGAIVGEWSRILEDGRGLYVRGLVHSDAAKALIQKGLDGLSIGFRPQNWTPRRGLGRNLRRIELVEISLVADPMLPAARFSLPGHIARAA